MQHELHAMERQAMREQIDNLEKQLKDMHADFEKCAHGISPCFFCANDDKCTGCPKDCNFVWLPHNYLAEE